MTDKEMLDWIKGAPYPDLLRKWRWEPIGSPWFKGEVGSAYMKKMRKCRETLSIQEAMEISRQIGFNQSVNPRDFKEN